MATKKYEFSTNNSSVSYAWTEGTPDSVRRLQNPASIIGDDATAYYIFHYRLYKIQTYSNLNATNRMSSTSIVEDKTIDESGAFTSSAYGEKLSTLNQYLLYFISGKSYFSSSRISEETLCTILNYIIKHLPTAITNDTIIDAETMKFIRFPAQLEYLSYIENHLMLPDFSADSSYDKLYTCLVNLTKKHNAKILLFISDMYIANFDFSDNRNLLQEYYYYLSLIASQSEKDALCHSVYSFVRGKKDFCYHIIFDELHDYEIFIKNLEVVKRYFPDELVIRALESMMNSSLQKQADGSEYVDLIIQSVDTLIENNDELKLATQEQLIEMNFKLTHYVNQFAAKKKLRSPNPEQLTIVEYFMRALKDTSLKANLEQATYQELNSIAEYCHTNHIETSAIKKALKEDIQRNADFIEYYECLYQNNGKSVKYTNEIPSELFINGLITLSEFQHCYGQKHFKKKWKETDRKYVHQRYGKTNMLSMKFLLKLWLSRRIYLWQNQERFLYLSDLNTEKSLRRLEKKGRKS
ncbi:MAG: hypothetical protein V3G42_10700 [Oscillospiraceae bacterium]